MKKFGSHTKKLRALIEKLRDCIKKLCSCVGKDCGGWGDFGKCGSTFFAFSNPEKKANCLL